MTYFVSWSLHHVRVVMRGAEWKVPKLKPSVSQGSISFAASPGCRLAGQLSC